MKIKIFLLIALCSYGLSLSSCKEEPVEDDVSLPTNLTMDILVSTEVEGLVEVSASADKANFYTFISMKTDKRA